MYSEELDICGTCDVLLYNTITGKYILLDYKTNKALFTSFGFLKFSPESIPDSNFNKYALQLSLYQIMLEEAGLDVEDRWILWTKRDTQKLYRKYSTPDYRHLIRKKDYLLI